MDCSVPEGDQSCEGGLMDDAFQFVLDNKGICAEADYPYVAKDEACKKTCKVVSKITGFLDVQTDPTDPKNETALMAAVMMGPVHCHWSWSTSLPALYWWCYHLLCLWY